jgi:hypothetical protein
VTIIGMIVGMPELHRSADGTPRLTLTILVEPAHPSTVCPAPPEALLVVAEGSGVQKLVEQLSSGVRVRVDGRTATGVVLHATAIATLGPVPDAPALPADPGLLLRAVARWTPCTN